MLKFIPIGGLDEKNRADYLQFSNVLACGGGWMVKADMILNKQFDAITHITRDAISLVKKYR